MEVRAAKREDIEILCQYDRHITREELEHSISFHRVYVAEEMGTFIGWLRYNLFWDNTPFMNMLYLLDDYRQKGYGRQLVDYWEKQMRMCKYPYVMTSTASNEYAQHFYIKLGYDTVGGFLFPNDPYEIILLKRI